jgi:ribosome-associated protein
MAEFVRIGSFAIPESELSIRAVRSSGPGGQNVNKVSTKITLRFSFADSLALTLGQKERLREAFPGYLTKSGELLLSCDETRSQEMNRDIALQRLGALLAAVRTPPRARRPTQPTRASKERRLVAKGQRSQIKEARRLPKPER